LDIYGSNKLSPAWVKTIYLKQTTNVNFYTPSVKSDGKGNSYLLIDYDTFNCDNLKLKSKKNTASFILLKFNQTGKIEWNFNLQDASKILKTVDWEVANDGSVFLRGNHNGPLAINGQIYDSLGSGFLLRVNKNGQFSWLKTGAEFYQASLYRTKNNGIGYFSTIFSAKNYKSRFGDSIVENGLYKGICELDSSSSVTKRQLFRLSNSNSPYFIVSSNGKGNTYAVLLLKKDTVFAGKNILVNQKGTKSSFYFMYLDKDLNPKWIKTWPHVVKNYLRQFTNKDFIIDNVGNLIMATEYNDTITMDNKLLIVDSSQINSSSCLSEMDSNGIIKWVTQTKNASGLIQFYPINVNNSKLYTYIYNNNGKGNPINIDTFTNLPSPSIVTYNTANGKVLFFDTIFSNDQNLISYSMSTNERFLVPKVSSLVKLGNKTYFPNPSYNWLLIKMDSIGSVGMEEISNPKGVICLIYPNPSKAIFNVKFSNSFTGQIVVINSMGQVIMQKNNLNATSTELNLESQSSGLYHIILTEKLGQTAQYQILKK